MFIKILINILIAHSICGLDVGDSCLPSADVLKGVCKVVYNCEIAVRYIQNKEFNKMKRCGFKGDDEVVCCPETNIKPGNKIETTKITPTPGTRVTQTQRKADIECQKIVAKSVPPTSVHIIDGTLASLGEFPHMVALGFEKDAGYAFECGGTLVSANYVLTAAHCVDNKEQIEPTVARMGLVELGAKSWNDSYDVRIVEIIKHPNYQRKFKYHDLALLRLEKSVEYNSNLLPACLYTDKNDPQIPLTITGWGTTNTSTRALSDALLKANLTVVPFEECARTHGVGLRLPQGLTEDQLCAKAAAGSQDTCQGDSGGPLQGQTSKIDETYRLVGVTSFGEGCGSKKPGVYVRVSRYLDWIESVVWPN